MSHMESDTDVTKLVSTDHDESDYEELTQEDKEFIITLVTTEYYMSKVSTNSDTYRCAQACTMCSENKPNFPTNEKLFDEYVQKDEKVNLSKENRQALHRDLVHNFFKKKWEDRKNNMKTELNPIQKEVSRVNNPADNENSKICENKQEEAEPSRNPEKNQDDTRDSRIRKNQDVIEVSRIRKNDHDNAKAYTSTICKNNHDDIEDSRIRKNQDVIEDPRTRKNDHANATTIRKNKQDDIGDPRTRKNDHDNATTIRKNNHDNIEDSRIRKNDHDNAKSSTIRNNNHDDVRISNEKTHAVQREVNRIEMETDQDDAHHNNFRNAEKIMHNQQIDPHDYEDHKTRSPPKKCASKHAHDHQIELHDDRTLVRSPPQKISRKRNFQTSFQSTFVGKPMNDRNGKFYIDRSYLDVKMYQDGLREGWNTTSCLYEICSKCGWGKPEFKTPRIGKSLIPKFVGQVIVGGKSFVTKRTVATKKSAQHLASAMVLHYAGFEFDYPEKEASTVTDLVDKLLGGNSKCSDRLDQGCTSVRYPSGHGWSSSSQTAYGKRERFGTESPPDGRDGSSNEHRHPIYKTSNRDPRLQRFASVRPHDYGSVDSSQDHRLSSSSQTADLRMKIRESQRPNWKKTSSRQNPRHDPLDRSSSPEIEFIQEIMSD